MGIWMVVEHASIAFTFPKSSGAWCDSKSETTSAPFGILGGGGVGTGRSLVIGRVGGTVPVSNPRVVGRLTEWLIPGPGSSGGGSSQPPSGLFEETVVPVNPLKTVPIGPLCHPARFVICLSQDRHFSEPILVDAPPDAS